LTRRGPKRTEGEERGGRNAKKGNVNYIRIQEEGLLLVSSKRGGEVEKEKKKGGNSKEGTEICPLPGGGGALQPMKHKGRGDFPGEKIETRSRGTGRGKGSLGWQKKKKRS